MEGTCSAKLTNSKLMQLGSTSDMSTVNLLQWNTLQISHSSCHLEHMPRLSKVHPVNVVHNGNRETDMANPLTS